MPPTGSPTSGRDRKVVSGSAVSSKQIAWAAVNHRLVKFSTLVGDQSGYVIGQDDFHWIIATVPHEGDTHQTALIHKGSAAIVTITDHRLEEERDQIGSAVTMAGTSFWNFCQTTYPNI
jgi:hypothetical protein